MTSPENGGLSVVFPPEKGESFDGYFTRNLAKAPLRSRRSVLDTIGVTPLWLAPGRLGQNPAALAAVAELLRQPGESVARLNMAARHKLKNHVLLDFHGAWVNKRCFLVGERRVSVSGLRCKPIHLAMWTLGVMAVDGQTMEPLLTHCPVCKKILTWIRAVRATHCDHCSDSTGRPSVDLRDFPQEPLPINNTDGYRFLYALLDPLSDLDPDPMMAAEWRGVKRGVQFEIALIVARWIAQRTHRSRLAGFSRASLKTLTPQVMADAGAIIRRGPAGLRDVEREYLSHDDREVLGRIVSLDAHISASAKEVVAGSLLPSRIKLREAGYFSPPSLAKKFGVSIGAVNRAADVSTQTVGVRESRLIKLDEKLQQAISVFKTRVEISRLRVVMEFAAPDVDDLIETGVLELVDEGLLTFLEGTCITGSSLDAARGRLNETAIDSRIARSFRKLWLARPGLSVGILFAAIVRSDLPIARLSDISPCWLDEYGTEDEIGLDQAVSRLLATFPKLTKSLVRRVGFNHADDQ
jgi:hypothetical protein